VRTRRAARADSRRVDDARVRTADCLPIRSRVVVVADARARAAHLDARARARGASRKRAVEPSARDRGRERADRDDARAESVDDVDDVDASIARGVRVERRDARARYGEARASRGPLEDAGVVGDDPEARARTREDGRRRGIDRDAARR
jgi:hypothetical protein